MNTSPLRIGIAGAGAIGCTLAARLAGSGHTVNVLARGETLATIRRDGIHLSDLDGHHHVRVDASNAAASGLSDCSRRLPGMVFVGAAIRV